MNKQKYFKEDVIGDKDGIPALMGRLCTLLHPPSLGASTWARMAEARMLSGSSRALEIVRVYTKTPGKPADTDKQLVLRRQRLLVIIAAALLAKRGSRVLFLRHQEATAPAWFHSSLFLEKLLGTLGGRACFVAGSPENQRHAC